MLRHKVVAELIGSDLLCAHEFDISCDTCRMRVQCLPAALDPHHLNALEAIIEERRTVAAGDFLYHQNQPFTALYRALTKETRRATEQHALVCPLDMPAGKPAVSI